MVVFFLLTHRSIFGWNNMFGVCFIITPEEKVSVDGEQTKLKFQSVDNF